MPSTKSEPFYLIPESLLQATLEYLSKRPFIEVAEAVAALRSLAISPSETE